MPGLRGAELPFSSETWAGRCAVMLVQPCATHGCSGPGDDADLRRDRDSVSVEQGQAAFLAKPSHRRYAVVEGDQLVGVITRKDILKAVNLGLSGT
jgi:hypothetical protein